MTEATKWLPMRVAWVEPSTLEAHMAKHLEEVLMLRHKGNLTVEFFAVWYKSKSPFLILAENGSVITAEGKDGKIEPVLFYSGFVRLLQ